jgi:hypothetical protein
VQALQGNVVGIRDLIHAAMVRPGRIRAVRSRA